MKFLITLTGVIQITFGLLLSVRANASNSSTEVFEIYNVEFLAISESEVQVTWNTNIPAQGFIFYAENDTTYGFPYEAMESFEYVTSHTLRLESLSLTSTYYFMIDQSDATWNNIRSKTYSFVVQDLLNNDPTVESIPNLQKLSTAPILEENVAFVDGAYISANVAYIVDSYNRLYKTSDGGLTWQNISPKADFPTIVGATPRVSFINENIGAVAFSVDDGANGYNYDIVYANVYCTTDGGQTWSDAFVVNDDQVKHLQQVSENVLYISGAASFGVSSGRWFKKIVRDETSGVYTLSNITTTPSDRPHVQAGAWLNESFGVVIGQLNVEPYTSSIFKTTDGGASWTKLRDIASTTSMHAFFSLQSDKSIKIFNENNIIVSTYAHDGSNYISELLVTSDGGVTWNSINPCPPNPTSSLVNLYVSYNGEGLIGGYTADDTIAQPIYYTEDFGQTWTAKKLPDLKSPIWINDVEITDDGCIWAIGSYGSIWKTAAPPVVLAPVGHENQTLVAEATIADLLVKGENIQWYNTAVDGTVIGPTTFVEDGTTYYASQTIEGVESQDRLAVTVNLIAYDADFVSVRDGNWNDASTWSFDTNATAIPNDNSDVLIQHAISVQTSSGNPIPTCANIEIMSNGRIYGYASAYSGPGLTVRNHFINYGTFNWNNDCALTVEGSLYNYGIISGDESYNFNINLYGDLVNSGSFRAVGHATSYFSNGINLKGTNGHTITCLNDSIIYSRYIAIDDPDGWMVIDSLANISGAIRLGGQGLVLEYNPETSVQLVMNNASIFGGIVYANGNEIVSKEGSVNSLGYLYSDFDNLNIQSAKFVGDFRVAGATYPFHDKSLVILEGENELYGSFYDWYTTNTYSANDQAIVLKGVLMNYGEIRNASSSYDFIINQFEGSLISNYGELQNKRINLYGNCVWDLFDTISVNEIYSYGDTSSLSVNGNLLFDETVTMNFDGGSLFLEYGSDFKTMHEWYNSITNTDVYGILNNLRLVSIKTNTSFYDDASISYSVIYGDGVNFYEDLQVEPGGYFANYTGEYGDVTIHGNMENYGVVKVATSGFYDYGTFNLHLKKNLVHNGSEWSNSITYIDGYDDQYLIFPEDSVMTSHVSLVASYTGSSYQWQKDGENIAGATAANYDLSGINSSKYGWYQCFIDEAPGRLIFIGNAVPPPFEITDVFFCNLDETQTYVAWKTSAPTTGFVFYAKNDTTYGFPFEAWEDWEFKTEHSLILSDLEKDSTYYFIIDAMDEDWNDIRTKTYSFVAGEISNNLFAIESVVDVPDDEGGFVELTFNAHKFDSIGLLQDYNLMMNTNENWETIKVIDPAGESSYSFIIQIPNEFNFYNEVWAEFKLITNYIFEGMSMESNTVEGAAIDNLAPATPSDIVATVVKNGKVIELTWAPNTEPDFAGYIIYRNGEEYFQTSDYEIVDENIRNGTYTYEIQAVDMHGNHSEKSEMQEALIYGYIDFDIYDIVVKPISSTSATVFWKTSIPAMGYVYFTNTNLAGSDTLSVEEWTDLQMNHSITLDNLTAGATYDFMIEQFDRDGFMAQSEILTFQAGNMEEGALSITSVIDVPDDQGGWVYVNFESDILDKVGEIVRYGVWEWLEDRWVSLGSIPATQAQNYAFMAHTNADSIEGNINWSKFFVSAHTANPMMYYSSAPDSGYSVDNIIPEIPSVFIAEFNIESKSVVLNWNANADVDFQYYKIYRNSELLNVVAEPSFEDFNIVEEVYDYNITAVDIHGNESELSATMRVITVDTERIGLSGELSIFNYPNPVQSVTNFKINAQINEHLLLEVYDIQGKRIQQVFDGVAHQTNIEVSFEVNDLEQGVYYYILTSDRKSITQKLIIQ